VKNKDEKDWEWLGWTALAICIVYYVTIVVWWLVLKARK
jgi:hypothetical protein